MSRIFYNILIKKYPLVLIIWIILPLISICQDTTKTVDDYFNAGADKYINNKSTEALKLVQQGLAIDSSDEKLKKLAELILKKDKNQQQQNNQNQNQNQNKDQNKDKDQDKNKDQDNQDKKDDNKDQKQDDKNNQLTKSDAERMLDALNNKDKNLQDDLQKEKVKAGNTQVEKDW